MTEPAFHHQRKPERCDEDPVQLKVKYKWWFILVHFCTAARHVTVQQIIHFLDGDLGAISI